MSKVSALWTAVVAVVILITLPLITKQHQSATFVFTSFINHSSGVSSGGYVFLIGMSAAIILSYHSLNQHNYCEWEVDVRSRDGGVNSKCR